jgi:rubredoxin
MSQTTAQILCNKCKVPPEPIADSQPETWRCPRCGVSDTRENILREVKEHATEVAARYLQDGLRDAVRGNRFLKVESKPIPKRSYRFVTDFKP